MGNLGSPLIRYLRCFFEIKLCSPMNVTIASDCDLAFLRSTSSIISYVFLSISICLILLSYVSVFIITIEPPLSAGWQIMVSSFFNVFKAFLSALDMFCLVLFVLIILRILFFRNEPYQSIISLRLFLGGCQSGFKVNFSIVLFFSLAENMCLICKVLVNLLTSTSTFLKYVFGFSLVMQKFSPLLRTAFSIKER